MRPDNLERALKGEVRIRPGGHASRGDCARIARIYGDRAAWIFWGEAMEKAPESIFGGAGRRRRYTHSSFGAGLSLSCIFGNCQQIAGHICSFNVWRLLLYISVNLCTSLCVEAGYTADDELLPSVRAFHNQWRAHIAAQERKRLQDRSQSSTR